MTVLMLDYKRRWQFCCQNTFIVCITREDGCSVLSEVEESHGIVRHGRVTTSTLIEQVRLVARSLACLQVVTQLLAEILRN